MARDEKIRSIESLHGVLEPLRTSGCAIIHTHGTFDLLHVGAIRHLEQAKKLGGVLVVTIAPDCDVVHRASRPLFNQELRVEALAALACVDYVAVGKSEFSPDAIQALRPDIYVVWEGDNNISQDERTRTRETEEALMRATGGQVVTIPGTRMKGVNLIHHSSPAVSPEVAAFLESFCTRYKREDVDQALATGRKTSVLFIGEAIIDEYQYCESIGKSGKEPVLAVRYISEERFAGGVFATANQAAAFCDRLGLITLLGTKNSHEEFIHERLNPKIDASFLYMAGACTILKRRLVEIYPFQKLFEVYFMDQEVPQAASNALYARLQAILPNYDAVVVTDYGHGLFTPEIVELLCSSDRFLAVNTQTNAANQGFNNVSKYRRADFMCLSEKELRLEVRNRTRDLRSITSETAERLSCKQAVITRGRSGNLCYHAKDGFFSIPSFTTRIVDRVGAGDASLAVASLCAAKDVPMELIGFIGNAVGAHAVETVGNRAVVGPQALSQQIDNLLNYDQWISTL